MVTCINMETETLKQQLISRITTWCGVEAQDDENSVTTIYYQHIPIARFPKEDAIESCLCGSMHDRITSDDFELPDGVWLTNKDHHLIVDLRLPGGIEEAVRVILNAYIFAQNQNEERIGLDEKVLKEDSKCSNVNGEIKVHRQKLAKRYAEYPAT